MVVGIHQPDYIPYLGLFYKMSQSDFWVFLDDVQFSSDNFHHWNRVKTANGEVRLKIPVEQHFGDLISAVRTRDELRWKEKHLKTLELSYAKAPFFKECYPKLKELILSTYPNLAEQNITINSFIAEQFGILPRNVRGSSLSLDSAKDARVIDICKAVGGDVYLSGNGARAYQVDEHFTSQGLELRYVDYHAFDYPQLWGEFIPNLSVLDYIFNCGYDWDRVAKQAGGH